MKACVLIPSFNEEKTIGGLVKSVLDQGYRVLVIDDGSSDATATIAKENGAEVLVNEKNMGKGLSLRRAFTLLAKRDFDAVITMDGDGQHLPSDLAPFVNSFEQKKPGIIVGNRMLEAKGMPPVRWLTNKFMSFLISCFCHQSIPDSQCGFRLIDVRVLKKMNLQTDNFEIESEMLLEAAKNGFRIESVPIATVYEGQHSAINPWKDTIRFFKFLSTKI